MRRDDRQRLRTLGFRVILSQPRHRQTAANRRHLHTAIPRSIIRPRPTDQPHISPVDTVVRRGPLLATSTETTTKQYRHHSSLSRHSGAARRARPSPRHRDKVHRLQPPSLLRARRPRRRSLLRYQRRRHRLGHSRKIGLSLQRPSLPLPSPRPHLPHLLDLHHPPPHRPPRHRRPRTILQPPRLLPAPPNPPPHASPARLDPQLRTLLLPRLLYPSSSRPGSHSPLATPPLGHRRPRTATPP